MSGCLVSVCRYACLLPGCYTNTPIEGVARTRIRKDSPLIRYLPLTMFYYADMRHRGDIATALGQGKVDTDVHPFASLVVFALSSISNFNDNHERIGITLRNNTAITPFLKRSPRACARVLAKRDSTWEFPSGVRRTRFDEKCLRVIHMREIDLLFCIYLIVALLEVEFPSE